jgi:hypothetical protein
MIDLNCLIFWEKRVLAFSHRLYRLLSRHTKASKQRAKACIREEERVAMSSSRQASIKAINAFIIYEFPYKATI